MRTTIVHEGVKHLTYEIREIVDYGHRLMALGLPMDWENIGDPIAMGEPVAPWIRAIVENLVERDASWGYCPSRGVLTTREFLAGEINKRGGAQVGVEDLLFVNGLADAVDKIYDLIRKDARVLMQSPIYATHSSNEGKRGEYAPLTFKLDPDNDWRPDPDEIERQVRYNPQIVAIALVNPDNPTGQVYDRATLEAIVAIARKYKLFIIADEIYVHICYNGAKTLHLSEVVGDVPALALRGISKDYPWPGSRCGWIEMLNREGDPAFKEYCEALVKSKMMEVCSTTLPQMSIPLVYGDPRYAVHMRARADAFAQRGDEFYEFFKKLPGVRVSRPRGAFYFSVVFEPGVLNHRQTLPIADKRAREFVEAQVGAFSPDKRFVYYLMASAGICVTPLSGFNTNLPGFRLTTLRTDDAKRNEVLERLGAAITAYLGS